MDERLYLASTIRCANDTASDKENTSLFPRRPPTTNTSRRTENRAFIAEIYESENDDTEDDTYLTSSKEIEESPYYFSTDQMLRAQGNSQPFVEQRTDWRPDNFTQTRTLDQYDHATNTDDDMGNESDSSYESPLKSKQNYFLTPTKYRGAKRRPLSSIYPTRDTDEQDETNDNHQQSSNSKGIFYSKGEKFIIPTKYQAKGRRNSSHDNENNVPSRQRSRNPSRSETRPAPAGRQDSRSDPYTPSRGRASPSPPSRDVTGPQRPAPPTPLDKRGAGPIRGRSPTPPPDRYRRETSERPSPPEWSDSGRGVDSRKPPPVPESSRRRDDDPRQQSSHTYIDDRREPVPRPRSPSPQNNRYPEEVSRKNTAPTPLDRTHQQPTRGRSPVQEPSQHKDSRPPQFNGTRNEPHNTRSPLPAQGFPPYQIIDGHLEIRDKSVDGSQHGQESDHSQMEVVFKATLRGQDIRERSRSYNPSNSGDQNLTRTDGKRPFNPDRSTSFTADQDRSGLNKSTGFLGHPSAETEDTSSSRLKPPREENLRLNEAAKDATTRPPQPIAGRGPRIYHQSGGPTSSVYSPPLFNNDTRYLNSATNARPELLSLDVSPQYNFDVGCKSYVSDDDNEEADCIAFGHQATARPYAGNQSNYATPGTMGDGNRQERINSGAQRQPGTTTGSFHQQAGTGDYQQPSNTTDRYSSPAGGGQSGAKGLASSHLGSSTTYNGSQARPGNVEVAGRQQAAGVYDGRDPSRTNQSTSQRNQYPSDRDQSMNTYENQSSRDDNSPTSPDNNNYHVQSRQNAKPYQNRGGNIQDYDDDDEDVPPRFPQGNKPSNGYLPNTYDSSMDDSDIRGRGTPKASDGAFSALITQNPVLASDGTDSRNPGPNPAGSKSNKDGKKAATSAVPRR